MDCIIVLFNKYVYVCIYIYIYICLPLCTLISLCMCIVHDNTCIISCIQRIFHGIQHLDTVKIDDKNMGCLASHCPGLTLLRSLDPCQDSGAKSLTVFGFFNPKFGSFNVKMSKNVKNGQQSRLAKNVKNGQQMSTVKNVKKCRKWPKVKNGSMVVRDQRSQSKMFRALRAFTASLPFFHRRLR